MQAGRQTVPAKKPRSKAKPARAKTARARPARKARAAKAPAMPKPVPGTYAHIELYSEDPEATRRFYTDVFGWAFERVSYGPGMEYLGYRTPAMPHGGLMDRATTPPTMPGTLAYIHSDDIDATARRIEDAGGKVLQGKFEVPNVGWMLVFQDPGGVVQAVWQHNPDFRPK